MEQSEAETKATAAEECKKAKHKVLSTPNPDPSHVKHPGFEPRKNKQKQANRELVLLLIAKFHKPNPNPANHLTLTVILRSC